MLVVIQALDAGGKDGTIRHMLSGVNPAGVGGAQLQAADRGGARARLSLALRQHLPAPGEIAVFNRSHYEEVLVVRVHPDCWRPRATTPAATARASGNSGFVRSTSGSAGSSTTA